MTGGPDPSRIGLTMCGVQRYACPCPLWTLSGFDAPICQDGRSGGCTELLARAEVSHDALIDFPSEKAFKASDDVPFRPSIRPASDDRVDRRLVIAHTDHDGSMEGGVRLSVAAPIEAVSTGGHPGGGGDGTRAAELGKGGVRTNPVSWLPYELPAGDDRQISSEDRRAVELRVRPPPAGTHQGHRATSAGSGMMLTVKLTNTRSA